MDSNIGKKGERLQIELISDIDKLNVILQHFTYLL